MAGHVVIVTGAGQGIGRAVALRLALEGASLVLNARTVSDLDAVAAKVRHLGGSADVVPGDAANEATVQTMIAAALEHFGPPTALVTCAGSAPLATIEALDTETFDRLLAVNIRAPYLATRAVWPHLKAAGGGTIVHVSSMGAFDPFPGFAAYGGSKAFINTFVRGLAAEGADAGIRVFAVAPGAVETRMLRALFPDFPADETLPPDDVADLIVGLLTGSRAAQSGETVQLTRQRGTAS